VSKVKSPQQKKALSLARDRRNAFRENCKASRKGIPRSKQRSHQGQRRAVERILGRLRAGAQESEAVEADILAKTEILRKERTAFKKHPDAPLREHIAKKLERRKRPAKPEVVSPSFDFSVRQVRRGAHARKEASSWKAAILRDAPLVAGYCADEPQWRERVLRWCDRVAAT